MSLKMKKSGSLFRSKMESLKSNSKFKAISQSIRFTNILSVASKNRNTMRIDPGDTETIESYWQILVEEIMVSEKV